MAIIVGNGGDNLLVGNAVADSISGLAGNDTLWGQGGNDTLRGGEGHDELHGGDGDDLLTGGAGRDTLGGGVGNDTLDGGNGDDLFLLSTTATDIDVYLGGGGTDTARLQFGPLSNLTLDAAASIEVLDFDYYSLEGTAGTDMFDLSGVQTLLNSAGVYLYDGADSFTGSAAGDMVDGGNGRDTIMGGLGDDTLDGGRGNDVLNGGDGNDLFVGSTYYSDVDTYQGGTGTDTYQVGFAGISRLKLKAANSIEVVNFDFYSIDGGSGDDVFDLSGVQSYVDGNSFYLGGGRDIFTGSDVMGDMVYGGNGADSIHGGGGNDTIDGGAGDDTLRGGAGDDTFLITTDKFDIDTYRGGVGTDTLRLQYGPVTNLTLDAAASVEVVNFDYYSLDGTNGANMFDLSGVQSYVDGQSVYLYGGADTFIGSIAKDEVYGGAGNDHIMTGRGRDTLDGGDGNDTLDGGRGNDTFLAAMNAADVDTYMGGLGTDTLRLQSSPLSNLTLDAAASIEVLDFDYYNLEGTAGNNSFDLTGVQTYLNRYGTYLYGGADIFAGADQTDEVYGGNGDDSIAGNGGNDTLDGGDGNDTLDGGAGDDIFLAAMNAADVDTYMGGLGTDTLRLQSSPLSNLTLDAAASIEVLDFDYYNLEGTAGNNSFDLTGVQTYLNSYGTYLYGGADIFAGADQTDEVYGGNGDDSIAGNGGNDTLDGGDGNDTLDGGAGDDIFLAAMNAADVDTYMGGLGTDTLRLQSSPLSNLTLDAAASIEVLDFDYYNLEGTAGNNSFDLTGVQTYLNSYGTYLYDGADTFFGSDDADNVFGGGGKDVIKSFGGDDTINGGTGNDRAFGGGGNDDIKGQTGNDKIYGEAGNDSLRGQDGNDQVYGGAGNDTITGDAGNDTLKGGGGLDLFIFEGGFGTDILLDFSADDGEDIDLSAVGAISNFTDLITNHLTNDGGTARIDAGVNSLLLQGVAFGDVGVGLAYSADDFIF